MIVPVSLGYSFLVLLLEIEELRQIQVSFVPFHLRIRRSEKEAGSIQSVGIEIRIEGLDLSFHFLIGFGIGFHRDWKQNMEPWSWRLAVFFGLIVSAVVNRKGYSWKGFSDILGSNPLQWVVGMVIVAIQWKTVAFQKIGFVPVVVFVFGTYKVMGSCLLQVFDVLNINDEGISAVAGTANNAGSAKSKHFNNLLSNPARFLDNWPVKNAGQQILKVLEIVQGFKPDSESS